MRATIIGLLLATCVLPATAQAQIDAFVGPLSPGVFMSTFNMDPISETLRHNGMLPADQPGPPGPRSATAAPPAAPASLRFTPSLDRRKRNLAGFVAKSRAADSAGADDLARLFAAGDIIERFRTELLPVGLRVDDLADAYAVWWVNCWLAVKGDLSTPDKATAQAVRSQAARALLASGTVAGVSDATKQEFAEALLVQALLVDAALQQAKDSPDQLKAVAAAANQGAKGMGIDMTTLTLTPRGFVSGG